MSVAESALRETDINELWFVVSPQNPAKANNLDLIDSSHRLEMVKLSVSDKSRIKVCDREFTMSQPSYTADTLKVLREENPNVEFLIVVGTDVQVKLGNYWRNKEEIIKNHKFIVYPRELSDEELLINIPRKMHEASIYLDDMPTMNVSSTMIRQNILNGASNFGLIHSSVDNYIKKNNLYLS